MLKEVSVKRLNVGMYVSLKDIPWFKHPFLTSSFRITKNSEIRDILALGCETVLYDPKKSKAEPLQQDSGLKAEKKKADYTEKSSLKSEKASELRKRRQRFQDMERKFSEALVQAQAVMDGVKSGQIAFCDEAKQLSSDMAKTFMEDVDLSVQHINSSAMEEGDRFHGLNVMVLSLMLGKELGLAEPEMERLSFGALIHDVGLSRLPKPILMKQKLNKLELNEFRKHPKIGVSILSKMPDIDREVMKIVYQHHEESSGGGYPRGIKGEEIAKLSRIVAITDSYDRLINARDPQYALSPHKALSYLFAKKKNCFDREFLGIFIKMLGIYPPGTVCRFSSGDVGIVIGVDPGEPLHPEIIIYDPAIPKHDAIIYKLGVDLDMTIESTLCPKELDVEALNYLDSRTNIQYFPSSKN